MVVVVIFVIVIIIIIVIVIIIIIMIMMMMMLTVPIHSPPITAPTPFCSNRYAAVRSLFEAAGQDAWASAGLADVLQQLRCVATNALIM